jgi:short-subunit dehydrogenase
MTEHWLVLGSSSAIARAFAREAARRGAALTLVGRDVADLEATAADATLRGASSARVLLCDAANPASRAAFLPQATLDGSVLNVFLAIGSMPDQDAMDTDAALLAAMIESTYSGPVALLQGLAATFEAQRRGRIVVVGSVAGDRGRRKNYLYGSAKAGLARYAEGLRARLYPCGATVTLIKPGFIDTSMTWGLPGLFLVVSPETCARAIMRAADRGAATVYVPFFWRCIMLIIQHIPAQVMKKLKF